MSKYIVNKNAQSDGYHEVHNEETCSYLPHVGNRIGVGEHWSCQSAVQAVREAYPGYKIDGCYFCCNPCHTR